MRISCLLACFCLLALLCACAAPEAALPGASRRAGAISGGAARAG